MTSEMNIAIYINNLLEPKKNLLLLSKGIINKSLLYSVAIYNNQWMMGTKRCKWDGIVNIGKIVWSDKNVNGEENIAEGWLTISGLIYTNGYIAKRSILSGEKTLM